MPRASREELPITAEAEGYEGRAVQWGQYTVNFERARAGRDFAPLFAGLPDDRCQCEHYGFVLKGALVVRYADREETIRAGEAYYLPPGHLPLVVADCELVEFTRTTELEATMTVIARNLETGVEPLPV